MSSPSSPVTTLLAAARASARRRWPAGYARARNGVSLARWAWSRSRATAEDPYDDAFWDFHDGGDWDGFAGLLVAHLAPRTLVDVGCGQGKLLVALRNRHPEVLARGVDSSPAALARARREQLDVAHADLGSRRRESRQAAAALVASADVAVCLETAEHLPPWSASPLVEMLTGARRVVFSAAQPGQGGTMHINEQPLAYWRARFRRRGYDLDRTDEQFRAAVGRLALPWWYAANVHVFSPVIQAGGGVERSRGTAP